MDIGRTVYLIRKPIVDLTVSTSCGSAMMTLARILARIGAGIDNCSMKRYKRRWFALRGVLLSYSGDHLEEDRKGCVALVTFILQHP